MPEQAPARPTDEPAPSPVTSQQCGRCRRVFEMEPTTVAGTMAEMWLCASCKVALLGRPTSVARNPA